MKTEPNPEIVEIKDRLKKALEKRDVDFTEILRLSGNLARHDTENVRFSTNAGHLNQIGLQLVARQETAVAEIVKNAYDADATLVQVTFSGVHKTGGKLLVSDNGQGPRPEGKPPPPRQGLEGSADLGARVAS